LVLILICFTQGYFLKRREGDKTNTLTFCEPCGRVIRGKQRLQRINDLREFACCMGEGKVLCFYICKISS